MKILKGLFWGFICSSVCRTQTATVAPSSAVHQEQQTVMDFFDSMTLSTQASNNNGQPTEETTTSSTSSTSSAPAITLSSTSSSQQNDGNVSQPNQQQQQEEEQPTVPQAGTQTGCMGLSRAAHCVKAASQDMISSLFYFVFDQNIDTLLDDVCWKFPLHQQCLEEALVTCDGPERIQYDVALTAFQFICSSQGRSAVQKAWPCLADRAVGQPLRVCSQNIHVAPTIHSPCTTASEYISCVSSTFHERCSLRSANAVRELLLATLRPFDTFFNCPSVATTVQPTTPTATSTSPAPTTSSHLNTTQSAVTTTMPPPAGSSTTTEPTDTTSLPSTTTSEAITTSAITTTTTSLPSTTTSEAITTSAITTTTTTSTTTAEASTRPATFDCYDCHTGARGLWPNPFCSDTGYIDPMKVTNVTCETPCFARVSRGGVTRGCSTGFNGTFHGVFPLDHIVIRGTDRNMEIWSFCEGSGCNVQDMTPHYNVHIP